MGKFRQFFGKKVTCPRHKAYGVLSFHAFTYKKGTFSDSLFTFLHIEAISEKGSTKIGKNMFPK